MQHQTMKAISQGKVPSDLLAEALRKGMINREFIDAVAAYLRDRGELQG
jgi:hypothetical protein